MQLCSGCSATASLQSASAVRRRALPVPSAAAQISEQQTCVQEKPVVPSTRSTNPRSSILQREPIPTLTLRIQERAPPATPQPVPILHSSAYLRSNYISPDPAHADDLSITAAVLPDTASSPDADSSMDTSSFQAPLIRSQSRSQQSKVSVTRTTDSELDALQWALRKADASLDELEANPLPLQKAVYDISRGPVGTATSSAVQAAAKLTVDATLQAAKAAAPIGKWALSKGTAAAASLIKAAVVEGVKAEQRRATQIIRREKNDQQNKKR